MAAIIAVLIWSLLSISALEQPDWMPRELGAFFREYIPIDLISFGENSLEEGTGLVSSGKYIEASNVLRRQIMLRPNGASVCASRFMLAKAYIGTGELEKAVSALETVIHECPGSLEDHYSAYELAMIHLWQGDIDDALHRFQRLAEKKDGPMAPEARAMQLMLSKEKIAPDL